MYCHKQRERNMRGAGQVARYHVLCSRNVVDLEGISTTESPLHYGSSSGQLRSQKLKDVPKPRNAGWNQDFVELLMVLMVVQRTKLVQVYLIWLRCIWFDYLHMPLLCTYGYIRWRHTSTNSDFCFGAEWMFRNERLLFQSPTTVIALLLVLWRIAVVSRLFLAWLSAVFPP